MASVRPIYTMPVEPGVEREVSSNASVIIPAYNEARGIGTVLQSLCDEPALASTEIIVVDDGSQDETAAIVRRFPRVHLVQHRVNLGYGAAIRSGVKASRGKYVVWFDGDTQHRVEDLLQIVEAMSEENLDYCIGIRDASSHHEMSRRLGKGILKRVVRFAAGQPVKDFNSGLRSFRRDVLARYLHLLPKGFGASTTTTLLMLESSFVGKEIPILVRARVGKSSVRQIRDGFRTLLLILRIFLLFKPLHFFGSLGLLLLLSGGVYGVYTAFRDGLGFPTLGAVAMLFGVQMMVLGLLCDQISAMRRERLE